MIKRSGTTRFSHGNKQKREQLPIRLHGQPVMLGMMTQQMWPVVPSKPNSFKSQKQHPLLPYVCLSLETNVTVTNILILLKVVKKQKSCSVHAQNTRQLNILSLLIKESRAGPGLVISILSFLLRYPLPFSTSGYTCLHK